MSKKRILIIGINCWPELTGIGKYTGEMIDWLARHDYEVTAVTAFPYYPQWKVQQPYTGKMYKKEILQGGKVTIYRCPMYVPSKPSGMKRMIHEASFFISAFFVVLRLLFKEKHDVVFSMAPPFHLGLLAMFYRLFKKAKIVYHIQDLQIDAAKELKMLKPTWIFSILFGLERFILNRVDIVSTISEGMRRKVKAKTGGEVMLFPNWVDVSGCFPVADRHRLKPNWGFLPSDKLVVYSGSIGEKQGLDSVLRIAAELRSSLDIKFIICGSGPFKPKLEEMAKEMELDNVHFLPLQPNEVFNDFLNIGDVHLVLQKADASDLVMPSKLTSILAVGGLALVTANPGTSLYEVVSENDMGVVIAPEDEELLKEAIVYCCGNGFVLQRANARAYATDFLNKDSVLNAVLNEI